MRYLILIEKTRTGFSAYSPDLDGCVAAARTRPIFEPLKDPDYFRRFTLEGGTVAWPDGADVAPETLHE